MTWLGVGLGVGPHPALAGTPAAYPEYPYAATDYGEPLRGQFHFSAQNGFMGDVNAPLYYRGTYHLFFQHNPHGLDWDTMHWGHATSPDLVHWTQQPIALEPGVHTGLLWSGSGWVDVDNVTGLKEGDDDPILLFTGVGGVSIAYSTDGARTFRMYAGGAQVITDVAESRDPKVTWDPDGRRWVMVTFRPGTGAAFHTSTNLLDWSAAGTYAAPWFVECPDLYRLPLDGGPTVRWVLQDASGEYVVGSLDASGTFVALDDVPQRMDWGRSDAAFAPSVWYAAQTFNQLPGGRVVQMAWQPSNAGVTWTGNASFPVELRLQTFSEGVRLTRNPVDELATLRSETRSWGARPVTPDGSDPLTGLSGDTYEIDAVFSLAGVTASEFGFRLDVRADGTSGRTVSYRVTDRTLYGMPLPATTPDRVHLRLLVDRGQLEVFGNDGRSVLSDNVAFDPSPESRGISLFATGGSVRLESLRFSPLSSAWTPAPAGVAPDGAIVSTSHQRLCVDHDVATGTAQLWGCLGNPNQTWAMSASGRVTTGSSCLQSVSVSAGNRSPVSVAACSGAATQVWRAGNYGSLVNVASGRCLDVPEARFEQGRALQLYDCVGTRNQSWVGPPYTPAVGRIGWNGTASCVDLDVASGRVQIWGCNGLFNQTWRLERDSTLRTAGVCMQVVPAAALNGARVTAAACTPTDPAQRWRRDSAGRLRNDGSSRCLDLDSGNRTDGRPLIVWDCVGGPNQRWDGPGAAPPVS